MQPFFTWIEANQLSLYRFELEQKRHKQMWRHCMAASNWQIYKINIEYEIEQCTLAMIQIPLFNLFFFDDSQIAFRPSIDFIPNDSAISDLIHVFFSVIISTFVGFHKLRIHTYTNKVILFQIRKNLHETFWIFGLRFFLKITFCCLRWTQTTI